jgi:8-oxo-dGTP pyrophosphatase MutT (NUDIX family)
MAIKTRAAGIFLVNKDGKILLGHPSGNYSGWSIPKGKIEEGEDAFTAALRECYEETNIDLREEKLTFHELPVRTYSHKKKDLKSYIVFEVENSINFSTFDIKCNSYVPMDAKVNAGLPEMEKFSWSTFDEAEELIHITQKANLNIIRELWKKLI